MLRREALQLLALELSDGLPFGERLRHWLAIHLGKLRLVVVSLEVRRTTGHAEKNHTLCLGGVVRSNGPLGESGLEGLVG